MTKATDTLILNVPVKRQTLRDLLCTAVEGGSNYWADFSAAERTEGLDYVRVKVTEQEKHDNKKPRVNRYISADELTRGLEELARCAVDGQHRDGSDFPAAAKHLIDAVSDHDATTADVVLQMTVFGELVYG